jgi:pSer/pThr/pTyr-binding forkhead associated (FHA) protein
MAKLVIVTQGMTGSHELHVDRTTIGRVDDNTFQITDPSVSSHHCEVHLRGGEIVIRDLNSTNGTYINGEQITESVFKPGQTLKLGNVELRLEAEGQAAASAKKRVDSTMVIPRGVSLDQLEQGGRAPVLDPAGGFSKKTNRGNLFFWIGVIAAAVVIGGLLIWVFAFASHK